MELMNASSSPVGGLWLPLITPFRDGELDVSSLARLVIHFASQPIDGFILGATTGEGMVLDDGERARLVGVTNEALAATDRKIPVYFGLSGSDTRTLAGTLDRMRSWGTTGYLISCPYYTRPSQRGLLAHFSALSESTDRPILVYNIPYRTGVNLSNETMFQLAERANIVGVKDCCADAAQSFDLIRQKPERFAVLTGEDSHYYTALAQGADGGILVSAHVQPTGLATIRGKLLGGDRAGALADWADLADLPRLLFAEPSPGAVKHWLWRAGLIDSPEMRLPMVPISADLAARIDKAIPAYGE
ncbi:UNVERIFIED_ORG: 4-hydroxy-tetrahydrodipicolinate synthase (plasmid) [Roseateles sp. XES5]|nr:4-hydroxy-tetrahydrodipicolinate synthase [Roseateles sp. XES5]